MIEEAELDVFFIHKQDLHLFEVLFCTDSSLSFFFFWVRLAGRIRWETKTKLSDADKPVMKATSLTFHHFCRTIL